MKKNLCILKLMSGGDVEARIPEYGIWDTDGFTVQFEKVRTFKKDGPKMTLTDLTQDQGPTQPPEAKKTNEGLVKNSVEAPVKPQEVKLDELNAKKLTLHHPAGVEGKVKTGKPRRNSPPDVSPAVPEFGDWDKSRNFTEIFEQNERGGGGVKPGPTGFPTEKPKRRKKGGLCGWLCGCCFP